MVPEIQIQNELKQGKLINLIPSAETDVNLYWHHWKQQSEPLKILTHVLVKQAQTIMIQN